MGKITKKLEDCIERKDFYQAQQLCLSLYSRWKRKDSSKAFDILVSGCKLLLPRGDVTAGSELALTLSKGYLESELAFRPEHLERAQAIVAAFPDASALEHDEEKCKWAVVMCEKFVAQASRWCATHGQKIEAATLYMKLGRYTQRVLGGRYAGRALLYAMRANCVNDIVSIMQAVVTGGKPHEEELVLAKVVLQYLNFHCQTLAHFAVYAKVAKMLLEAYEKETGRTLPDTPLVHFVQLSLEALTLESVDLFTGLRERYTFALGQDAAIAQEATDIAAKIKPKTSKTNPFADMLKGLLSA